MWQSLKSWNWGKVIRVLIGFSILGQGISYGQTSSIIAGSVFTIFGIFTAGYCGTNTCHTKISSIPQSDSPELDQLVEFEELKKGT